MPFKDILLVVGVLLFVALAVALAGIRRRRRMLVVTAESVETPADDGNAAQSAEADMPDLLRSTLRRELTLAAEHVHSILCLLEIAREYQQPIPTAALTNLDLVSKHLGELQRRIEAGGEETAPEFEVSAAARHPEIQSPLRPRRSSFGCRASPSDISMPCD